MTTLSLQHLVFVSFSVCLFSFLLSNRLRARSSNRLRTDSENYLVTILGNRAFHIITTSLQHCYHVVTTSLLHCYHNFLIFEDIRKQKLTHPQQSPQSCRDRPTGTSLVTLLWRFWGPLLWMCVFLLRYIPQTQRKCGSNEVTMW